MRLLKPGSIPTPLVDAHQRPPIVIAPVPADSRFPAVSVIARLCWWAVGVLWLRARRRGSPAEFGRRFRLLLEDLGGLWVKAGQLLSLRIDLFPADFCFELAQLQGKAIGFPPAEAMRIVEADLGGPLDRFFGEFDEAPAAAASMGQVHLARLRESGIRVAVKVQRPHLPQTFAHQIRIISRIARLLDWLRPDMRWEDLIWELDKVMLEEMDCRYEGASTRRMRRTLAAHGIYAPKVFYSTRRVLVTEFVDGVLMADYIQVLVTDPARVEAWRRENRIDPNAVGNRLARSLLRQILEDNLYHGDLHPGNIMLLRDSGVALIDFGACSFTERDYLARFRLTMLALSSREFEKAADLSLLMCSAIPSDEVDAIREKFLRAMLGWARATEIPELPYHQKSIARFYNELARVMAEHRVTVDWTLLRIRRAVETLDASQVHLIPGVNYTEIPRRYFRAADRRAARATSPSGASAALLANVSAGFEMAEQLEEYTLFQAGIVRRHSQLFEGATGKALDVLTTAVDQLVLVTIAGTLVVVAGFLAQSHPKLLPLAGPDTVGRLARLFPALDGRLWTLILGASVYGAASLIGLRGRLQRHEPQAGERVAAV